VESGASIFSRKVDIVNLLVKHDAVRRFKLDAERVPTTSGA
jgi:hypothetical protein